VLEKGLALAPNEGELYYSLGLLQAEMGEHEAAAESLLAAAARLPSRRGVHRNAGLALQRVGRLAEAERILEDGARLDPHDPELQHALAYVFTAAGERAKALEHAARLFELAPESPEPEELIRQMEAELAGEEPR
jgi:Flp pilus assembly protein TadD